MADAAEPVTATADRFRTYRMCARVWAVVDLAADMYKPGRVTFHASEDAARQHIARRSR